MGFFSIIRSVSCGTDIFIKLKDVPLIKSVLHLFMLAILCTAAIIAIRSYPVYTQVKHAFSKFNARMGNVIIKENGVYPEKTPETARSFMVTDSLRMEYFPERKCKIGKLDDYLSKYGIIWLPDIVLYWKKIDNKKYFVMPVVFTKEEKESLPTKLLNRNEIGEFIQSSPHIKTFRPDGSFYRVFKDLGTNSSIKLDSTQWIISVAISLIFIKYGLISMVTILFSTFSYTIVSVSVFYILSRHTLKQLNYSQLFVIAVYTGFPATMVASCFPALDLPFFDYQTIYLAGFLVYFFVVINTLEKQMNKKTDKPVSE